ncbi:MAG: hypothetical protein GY796_06120, partial [Chloroflexi bacterium]|nr:hypothetical protein [Chloroflexota bacterium]
MSPKIGSFPRWSILIAIVFIIGVGLMFFNNRSVSIVTRNGGNLPTTNTQANIVTSHLVDLATDSTSPHSDRSLRLLLSEGYDVVQAVEPVPVAPGQPLSEADIQTIIDRLPTITADAHDELDFRLPDALITRPRTGDIINQPFPPPASQAAPEQVHTAAPEAPLVANTPLPSPPADDSSDQPLLVSTPPVTPDPIETEATETLPDSDTPHTTPDSDDTAGPSTVVTSEPISAGPLTVLRYAPEGELSGAPFVNITFNQPMVPLTNLGELEAADVLVTIAPALPGIWQ